MTDTIGIDDALGGLDNVSLGARSSGVALDVNYQLSSRHPSAGAAVKPINRADVGDALVTEAVAAEHIE